MGQFTEGFKLGAAAQTLLFGIGVALALVIGGGAIMATGMMRR